MKLLNVVPRSLRDRAEGVAEARAPRLAAAAKEAWRTYEVAKDVPTNYGAMAATLGMVQVSGVTFLVTGLLTPVGLVLALLLVPLWPWVFVLPALLLALSLLAGATAAFLLLKVLPQRLRVLQRAVRRAGEHAVERYQELQDFRANGTWQTNGNLTTAAETPT